MARYSAYVSNVIDGDTFDTSANERIRLEGIDVPERGTAAGHIASRRKCDNLGIGFSIDIASRRKCGNSAAIRSAIGVIYRVKLL